MNKFYQLLLIIFCIIFMVSNANSRILRVPSDDYKTLREAIDLSQNGDTIIINQGQTITDYNIYFNTEKNRKNVPRKDILIRGESSGEPNMIIGNNRSPIFTVNADGIVFENLIISNGTRGLAIEDSAPMIINCIIENNGTGITLEGLDSFLPNPVFIFNSSISNNSYLGIDTGGVAKYKILNCCICCNQNFGIIAHKCGTDSFIKNSIIKNNNLYGLTSDTLWNGKLANNVIDGNGTYGVFITGNALSSFTTPGNVTNNIFVNNSTAAFFDTIASDYKWDYTCFYNNGSDFNLGFYTNTTVRDDPRFANTNCEDSNNGYALQEGSPCIDAGNPAPVWNDFDGSRNDLGARGGPAMNLSLDFYVTHSYWAYNTKDAFNNTYTHEVYRSGESYTDTTGNGKYDAEEFWDDNINGKWDEGEKFFDLNLPGFQQGRYDEEPFVDSFYDKSKNGKDSPSKDWVWNVTANDRQAVPTDPEDVWNKYVWNGDDTLCIGFYITIPNKTTNLDLYFAIQAPGNPLVFLQVNDEYAYSGYTLQPVIAKILPPLPPNSLRFEKVVIPIIKGLPEGEYIMYVGIVDKDTGTTIIKQYPDPNPPDKIKRFVEIQHPPEN
ncbi:right-handed parallel beta-helix repeat-containing protein [bacterium]|nr:right-handed parallel beta-helix repeat-containing protein [bacterium]